MVDADLGDELGQVGGPDAQVAILGGSQIEGYEVVLFFRRCHDEGLYSLFMNLHNLVHLSTEIVDDVQKTTLCTDENLADFSLLGTSRLRILDKLVSTCGIVEHFPTRSVIQRD